MILPTYSTSVIVPRVKSLNEEEEPALNIFLCFDDEFAFPTGVCAFSILKSNVDMPVNIHLVGVNVQDQTINKFKELNFNPKAEVYFHSMDFSNCEDLTVGRKTKFFPLATFLRLLLPNLFPSLDKFLYLDSDTLCVNSLRELRDIDLKQNYAAVVKDIYPNRKLGPEIASHYFNSGMLLVNARLWREVNLLQLIFDILRSGKELPAPDQDALNIAFGDKKIILHKKYNYIQENFLAEESDKERIGDSVIVHYANRSKPWTVIYQTTLYSNYRLASPWKDEKLPLAYKNDPNSIRRYAFHKIKEGRLLEGAHLIAKYLTVEFTRKSERWARHKIAQ
ncbi:glycosyltransferase family 8 protein [uncultured Parasutterella sp.]|uniref:glycosyltransferase family 8 protein n=1 Tax=uncultured Parasutterella sp. TaxID=1263098 RepID=UPI0025B6D9AF|nr:glycosyltransferase family 8 protein [uncultured Parasutterella sp.]